MFCNDPAAFAEPYRRYLLGALREHLPFAEVPVKLYLRKRSASDRRAEVDTDSDGPEVVDADARQE
jgi:GTP-binding protein